MMDHTKESDFPTLQFLILAICRIGEPLVLTSIPLYLPAMLKSLEVPEQSVPYWASICISTYSVSLCLSASVWGWAADRWGRKTTILLANLLQMISMILFGLSRTLLWPVITLGFLGVASANSGTLRTTAAELVPWKELQPKAFGILPMVWNIGSIVGPVLGGLLSDPASQYPKIFGGNGFFTTFPWILPNLVVGILLSTGLISGTIFLEETLKTSKRRGCLQLKAGNQDSAYLPLLLNNVRESLSNLLTSAAVITSERPGHVLDDIDEHVYYQNDLSEPGRLRMFTRDTCINLVAHALLVTHSMIFDEFLPIFMFTKIALPKSSVLTPSAHSSVVGGGLGMQSSEISAYFTISAVYAVAFQIFIFPPLAGRFGALRSFRMSSFLFPLIYLLVPFLVLIPSSRFFGKVVVMVVLLSKTTITATSFPCSMILLNNSVVSKSALGTVNGLATSTSAFCRGVGALAFGMLFTFGLEKRNVLVPWWWVSIVAALGAAPLFWLTDSNGDEKKEENLRLGCEDD